MEICIYNIVYPAWSPGSYTFKTVLINENLLEAFNEII
jgi:hypothetical protein